LCVSRRRRTVRTTAGTDRAIATRGGISLAGRARQRARIETAGTRSAAASTARENHAQHYQRYSSHRRPSMLTVNPGAQRMPA
jgi:hypothetical protein